MLRSLRPRALTRPAAAAVVVFLLSGLLGLGAGPAGAVTDVTAPTLVTFAVTPSVDTSAAAQTLMVTARITDDVSGLGSSNSYFNFNSPSGSRSVTFNFDASKRISGTVQDGTYRATVSLPRWSEQGQWNFSYGYLYDASSHGRSYSSSDFATAGFSTSFAQTGVGDSTPPALTSFSMTPTVDTSAAAGTVTVTAHLTDGVSGLAVGSAQCCMTTSAVNLSSPSGRTHQLTLDASKRLSGGTAQDGDYQTTLSLPRWAEQGTYRITSVLLYDAANNYKTLTPPDLFDAGFPISFEQTGIGDITPPALASLTVSPPTIDTSAATQAITVNAHITDDAAGIGSASGSCCSTTSVTFRPPGSSSSSMSGRYIQVNFDASNRISGTARDGVYRSTVNVARYSDQGIWRPTSGMLYDAAGNYKSLSESDFVQPGFAATFNQSGVGDSTPPAIASFSLSPASVDTSAAARDVTVTARITDAVSGMSPYGTTFMFVSPSGTKTVQASLDATKRISGNAQDGVYQATITVPRYSEQGAWRMGNSYSGSGGPTVNLNDVAGNYRSVPVTELTDAGFTTTLSQTGIGDITPPVLSEFSFTPSTIDTAAATRIVTVTARITDDVSGLSNSTGCCPSGGAQVRFTAPSGSRSVTVALDSSKRTSGAALDGVYEASLAVPRYSEMGTWRITSGYFYDVAGNQRSMATADFAVAGFATNFNQTATGDSTPPVLAGLTITPATVDTSTSAQTVTLRAHITDDLSGLSPYSPNFDFTSPALGQNTTTPADSVTLVSGTARDGIYDIDLVVPRFGEGGTWVMTSVYLTDALGNARTLAIADVSGAGLPTTFVVAAVSPEAPPGVTAAAGNGSATVNWTAPAANGASPVTSYTVTAYAGSSAVTTKTVAAPATSTTVPGLSNGTAYTFTVMATNASGTGSASVASAAVTPRTVPGAPTGVTASASSAAATVNWTAPASNGGSALLSYAVTAYAGAAAVQTTTVTAPATSATITGLANGTTYTFTVAATNAAGTGAAATSNEVSPRAPTFNPVPIVEIPVVPVPVVTIPTVQKSGYWMIGSDGKVYAFGGAPALGSPNAALGSAVAVDLEPTASGQGYWVVDDLGRVFAYGDAPAIGNVDANRLVAGEKAISLSSTKTGKGYWVFTTKGRVLPFGDATFFGDVSGLPLNGPVIDSIPTASGQGYYMVASDGGIFSFGDAKFYGSMGGAKLNAPVQSLVPDGDGVGYWLVASDGGIFAFDAPFKGSLGAFRLNKPITGMVRYGGGYLMVAEDGGVFDFSGDPNGFKGSLGGNPPGKPIGSVAAFIG